MKKEIFEIFEEIVKIPHCSFKAEKFKKYLIESCEKFDAKVSVDKVGNIVALKGNPKVCLQSHYDMVCMGEAPNIKIIKEGNILRADNSSLGADNGIGIAIMLYLLQTSRDIELLFTSEEEVGLIGATNLNLELKSKYLLNLDSEEEGDIFVGCAGGVEMLCAKPITYVKVEGEWKTYELEAVGFIGGHSGVDADKDIKNAIKELAYFLSDKSCKISSLKAGEANNSIPKYVKAVVICKDELASSDDIKVTKIDNRPTQYIKESQKIISFLNSMHSGVRSYNRELKIVQRSTNLAIVETKDDSFYVELFPRAMSADDMVRLKVELIEQLRVYGFEFELRHEFPAWKPNIGEFAKKVQEISLKHFEKSEFVAIHAGLEAGVIVDKFPHMQAASIGPNIYFPHSTREYVEMDSVLKVSKVVEELIKILNFRI